MQNIIMVILIFVIFVYGYFAVDRMNRFMDEAYRSTSHYRKRKRRFFSLLKMQLNHLLTKGL